MAPGQECDLTMYVYSNLHALNDQQFNDAVVYGSASDVDWLQFMADDIIDRTYCALRDLHASMLVQQESPRIAHSPEAKGKLGRIHNRINARVGQVKTRVAQLDREEDISAAELNQQWKVLTLTLATALERAGSVAVLDDLKLPGSTLTVHEWLLALDAQRAAAALKRNPASSGPAGGTQAA